MHVIGVSIPRYRQRFEYINSHLKQVFGDKFEIVGVDGTTVGPDAVDAEGMTPGQIGCSLSHVAACKRIVELDLPFGFIVEDDCKLPRNIKSLLAELEMVIKPGDVIQLYTWSLRRSKLSSRNAVSIGGYRLVYPMQMSEIGNTTAYIVTREAAAAIAGINAPVKVTADNWSFFRSNGAVASYRVLYPSPVTIMSFKSTVTLSQSNVGASRNPVVQFAVFVRRWWILRLREWNVILTGERSPYDTDRLA